MNPQVETTLPLFLAALQAKMDAYRAKNFPTLPRNELRLNGGTKYIKISEFENGECRSIYCFIDAATGDVLKPESCKKPAKHARGNILTGDPVNDGCCGPYGIKYLTGGGNYQWGDV